MRSLIIIEVEHGEDTDAFEAVLDRCIDVIDLSDLHVTVNDHIVRVDLPECFVLDSPVGNQPGRFDWLDEFYNKE